MATRSKRTRGAIAMGTAGDDGDFPLHMDPSLMTERQQLAFLLRKTAQENDQVGSASPSSDFSSSDSSSESESCSDEAPRRTVKKTRRAPPAPRASPSYKVSPKSPPAATREEMIAAALKNPASLVLYCGRGRPPKNAIKLAPGEAMPADLKRLLETAAKEGQGHRRHSDDDESTDVTTLQNLRVKTSSNGAKKREKQQTSHVREKTSPSSTNDLSHMEVFEDHVGHGSDIWNTQCALCCRSNSSCDAPLEALFLCPTCDRKYPTQRALGLV